jgi:arginine exporter protein ArgO
MFGLIGQFGIVMLQHPYYTAGVIAVSGILFFFSGVAVGRKLHREIDEPERHTTIDQETRE